MWAERARVPGACFLPAVAASAAGATLPPHASTAQAFSSPLLLVSLAMLLYSVFRLLVARREIERKSRALAESEERYARITEGANDGLWDWNLRTDEVFFSRRWRAMLGLEVEARGGNELGQRRGTARRALGERGVGEFLDCLELVTAGRAPVFVDRHGNLVQCQRGASESA